MKWYIHREDPEDGDCWTITNVENEAGWCNYNSDLNFGMPREVAKAIIDCLNKADLTVSYLANGMDAWRYIGEHGMD